ncbi:MAG TPA: hypothetical protein VGL27_19230 [Negativicutes bacterium]|jgi:hypothetical protein
MSTTPVDDLTLTPEELSEIIADLPIILNMLLNETEIVSKFAPKP